jgi:hypothetical protein
MFDGNFEVIRHAGGQSDRIRVRFQHPAVLRLQSFKGLVGPPIQGRDAHQPDQSQALRPLDPGARRPSARAVAIARSSAVTNRELSIEWAVCAHRANDRALLR